MVEYILILGAFILIIYFIIYLFISKTVTFENKLYSIFRRTKYLDLSRFIHYCNKNDIKFASVADLREFYKNNRKKKKFEHIYKFIGNKNNF